MHAARGYEEPKHAGSPLRSNWAVALTGLGLTYALPMVSLLSSLLTSAAETEQELVSVERVLHFLRLPQAEASHETSSLHTEAVLSASGPAKLVLDHVTLTYPGCHEPALKGVSLRVEAGQHVGICGRTGAGKSSLLNAIFQLAALDSGTVTVCGVDLACISRRSASCCFVALLHLRCRFDAHHMAASTMYRASAPML